MTFELWDTESGNLLSVYATEAEALNFVRRVLAIHGPGAVAEWELFRMRDDGDPTSIAVGHELTTRASADRSAVV